MARPEPIQAHALENLRFIREAMSRASEFTAVPGWGGIFMGLSALVTAPIAGPPDDTSSSDRCPSPFGHSRHGRLAVSP